MKRIALLLALCFGVATFSAVAAPSNDSGDLIVRIQPLKNKVFKLTLANLQQESTKVTLTNLSGTTTFFEDRISKHNGYTRKLNISNLANGRYVLTVKQNGREEVKVLYLKDDQILVSGYTSN